MAPRRRFVHFCLPLYRPLRLCRRGLSRDAHGVDMAAPLHKSVDLKYQPAPPPSVRHYEGADFIAECSKCSRPIEKSEPRWYDDERHLFFHDACYVVAKTPEPGPAPPLPAPLHGMGTVGSPAEIAFRPASSYRDPLPPHATVELEVETVGEAVARRVLRVRLSLGVSDAAQLVPAGEALRKYAENIELSWLKEGRP